MSTYAQLVMERAQTNPLKLILPEGRDPRVLIAAQSILQSKIASEVTILGDPDKLNASAKQHGVNIGNVNIIDHTTDKRAEQYAHEYFELRKHKGLTEEQAIEAMKDDVFFGAKHMSSGNAHAMVSGSYSPTSKTLRAAIFFGKPQVKTISGAMIMEVPNPILGSQGRLVFGDCAVVPKPTAEQLADIAMSSAETARELLHVKPRVALLSFSTHGSAKSPETELVIEALNILKQRNVDFDVDGELQLDAAVHPETAALKAPNSLVAGKANVLIFPDLSAANIGYKLVHRFAPGAHAFGPLLQGLSLPINDLSRGCSYDDIIITSAITLNQAQAKLSN